YGQFMKFVKRGAYRISSTSGDRYFNNVAFLNPDGNIVLVIANAETQEKKVAVHCRDKYFRLSIPSKTVITCLIK
ncbi:MAG: glycoside hydrolase family 30 beta sandwich domain-containing protein, partial [Candidatus Hydrogenedens sp.]